MSDSQPIHIHLPEIPPGSSVHLHFGQDGASPEPAREMATAETDALRRLMAYGNRRRVSDIAAGLAKLGLVPHISKARKPGSKPGSSLRWTHGGEGPTVCYMNSARLEFWGKPGERISGMDGTEPRQGMTVAYFSTAKEVGTALAAAKTAIA